MAVFEGSRRFKDPEYGFSCISTTIDGLSYSPSSEEEARNATQIVATGRRSWKTLRGKGEAVWPPTLEAALLEALEKYKIGAVGVKGNKGTNRSPMRNRFISDYIFETTGKRRTTKQVGSRLQQLRNKCKEDKILKLLIPEEIPAADTSSWGTPLQPRTPSPASDYMPDASVTPHNAQLEGAFVCVHISLQVRNSAHSSDTTTTPTKPVNQPRTLQVVEPSFPPYLNMKDSPSFLPSAPIRVQLMSPVPLSGDSQFVVYAQNYDSCPIHMELVSLELVSSPNEGPGWVYRSALVPDFWHRLRLSTDPSIYTIVQTVSPFSPPSSRLSTVNSRNQSDCFSIIYDFGVPRFPQDHGHHCVIRRTAYDQMYPLQSELVPLYHSTSNVSMGGDTPLIKCNPWTSQVEVPNSPNGWDASSFFM